MCWPGRYVTPNTPRLTAPGFRTSTDGVWPAWDFQRWDAATREDVTTGVAQIREFAYNFPRSRIINSYVAWPRADEKGYTWDQAGIASQISTDATSITTYGYHGRDAPDLIIKQLKPAVGTSTGAEECKLFADFYVANYAEPRLNVQRVKFMSVMPDDPVAAATWELMTRADISDIIALTIDEAGLAAEDFYIEGFHKELRPANNTVDMADHRGNDAPRVASGRGFCACGCGRDRVRVAGLQVKGVK